MENGIDRVDKMAMKIKVLDSRIQHLESLANEILADIGSEFQQQIKELIQKKDGAQKTLDKIKNINKKKELTK